MRYIPSEDIFVAAKKLIQKANIQLPFDIQKRIQKHKNEEIQSASKSALISIIHNFELASKENIPLCQDTGTAVFFIEIGHEVQLDTPLTETLLQATREAYKENYFRSSIVRDPLYDRKNTGDNTPPILHLEQVSGDQLKIYFLPKGGGAENKSVVKMLRPADGEKGIINAVTEAAQNAGGSSCPPWVLGIGIGGGFDTVATLAKKAILRPLGQKNVKSKYAELEEKLITEIESLHIGAMGFGGNKTILGLHIETAPTHIASLPVAINFQCHSARSAQVTL